MEPNDPMGASSNASLSRGLALERVGRYAEAAEAFREAARLDPDDIDAQMRLGLVLREMGRDDEANEAFRMALDIRGVDVD
jgi:Flp pilus assembly protein TadD